MCIEAYAAGLLDGGGCIFAGRRSIQSGGDNHYLTVTFNMTDRAPLEELSLQWGGAVSKNKKLSSGGRNIYRWAIWRRYAQEFLEDVRPWVRGKKPQVELALRFPVGRAGHGLSPDERAGQANICSELRNAKKALPSRS